VLLSRSGIDVWSEFHFEHSRNGKATPLSLAIGRKCAKMRIIFQTSAENAKIEDGLAEDAVSCEPLSD
jgi:hypothetical protein